MAFRSKPTLRRFAEAAWTWWKIFCLSIVLTSTIAEVGSTGCQSNSRHLSNAHFLGFGYDIVKGNPEGQPRTASEVGGGPDPGLTHPLIKHVYNNRQCVNVDDVDYLYPDDVWYRELDRTYISCNTSAVYGSRSYEDMLRTQVEITAETRILFIGFMFGASSGFRKFSKSLETEQRVSVMLSNQTTYGEGRIQPGYKLKPEFSLELCELQTEYLGNEEEYHQFFNKWGTHVVNGATFGESKHISVQYQLSKMVTMRLREVSGDVRIGGRYKGFSASIGISGLHKLKFQDYQAAINGSVTISKRGSRATNEPITYKLWGMDVIAEDGPCNNSDTLAQNIRQAYASYPEYLGVEKSADSNVVWFPLTWPDGTYTLPRSFNGCPEGDVSWGEGSRLFDVLDDNLQNEWEPENIHLDLPIKEKSRMEMTFCTKTTSQSADYRRDWESGTYCIFRYGDKCPKGFENGFIFWNDDGTGKHHNDYDGIVPAGDYTGRNTNMSFCCRTDAEVDNAIILPVDHDFFLMTPTGHCQKVFGMQSTKERFHWDTADFSQVGGLYPNPGLKNKGTLRDVEIDFCFYQRINNSHLEPEEESSDRQGKSTDQVSLGSCLDYLRVPVIVPNTTPTSNMSNEIFSTSSIHLLICIISGILLACP